MRTLHLTLKKPWFEVMVSREKRIEYREPTKWILSRLFDKNGNAKHYDRIKFTNGYGSDKPFFIAEFISASKCYQSAFAAYSGGLQLFYTKDHTIAIVLGKIIETGNLKQAA